MASSAAAPNPIEANVEGSGTAYVSVTTPAESLVEKLPSLYVGSVIELKLPLPVPPDALMIVQLWLVCQNESAGLD